MRPPNGGENVIFFLWLSSCVSVLFIEGFVFRVQMVFFFWIK